MISLEWNCSIADKIHEVIYSFSLINLREIFRVDRFLLRLLSEQELANHKQNVRTKYRTTDLADEMPQS